MLIRKFIILMIAGFGFATPLAAQEIGDDGLHKQDWFLQSFLNFGDDLQEAADEGKDLLVIIEQKGCPYCRELHEVNFARTEITDYIQEHFLVVQIDLFGSHETVDFDGEELEERDLVEKWGAQFTPTTIAFSAENVGASGFEEAEVFRLPGYLKPFHYMSSLEYVSKDIYKETTLQRYIGAKITELVEQGIEPDVW